MPTSLQNLVNQVVNIVKNLTSGSSGTSAKTTAPTVVSSSSISVPKPPSPVSLSQPSSGVGVSFSSQQPKQPTTQPTLNVQTSIVDYLKSIGMPSDFASRAKLAQQYGITDYRGTAEQNIKLLNLLKSGQQPKTTTPTTVSSTQIVGVTGATTTPTQTSSKPSSISTPSPTTQAFVQPPAETQPQDIDALIEQKTTEVLNKYLKPVNYDEVAQQAKKIAEEFNRPLIEAFNNLKETLREQFRLAREDLMRQHEEEKQKLIGSWAARGFSPDDAVVRESLQRLQDIQNRELVELANKEATSLAQLGLGFIKTEPSSIVSIMNSLLATERTELANVLDILEKLAAARERRRQKEVEQQEKEREQIQTRIEELDDGVYLVTYGVNPRTGETRIISKIKLGAKPSKSSEAPKAQTPKTQTIILKDFLGQPSEAVIIDKTTGEIISRTPIKQQQVIQPQTKQQKKGIFQRIKEFLFGGSE